MTILNCVSAGPIKRFSIKIVAFFHNWQHSFLGLVQASPFFLKVKWLVPYKVVKELLTFILSHKCWMAVSAVLMHKHAGKLAGVGIATTIRAVLSAL
jgi:hypothetical protein